MRENPLKSYSNIFFIGIGGIGVSAIASMMLLLGKNVSGSDSNHSNILENLRMRGAKVFVGHNEENILENIDLVIYTVAISDDNPELKKAKELGIPTLSYPEALGLISQTKKTIAIAGTHGKTTTTGMIAEIFLSAHTDPTVVIGSFLKRGGDYENFIAGNGEWLIAEACEYRKSFLNLSPYILVITNIDNDHLDYYGTIENVQKAFAELARKVRGDGFIVTNPNNALIKPALANMKAKIIDYTTYPELALKIPGAHNRKNAQAAYAVGELVGISKEIVESVLTHFFGTWRRQEFKGKTRSGALVYDDYAHHPTEIKATLAGFREMFPDKKITLVFQPHLYSRTKLLFNDFVEVLAMADFLIVMPIYAARERPIKGVTSKKLAEAIKKKNPNTLYMESFNTIAKKLSELAGKDDVIITMGAGDVYKVGEKLVGISS